MRANRLGLTAVALGLSFSLLSFSSFDSSSVRALTVDRAHGTVCLHITNANYGYCCRLRNESACSATSQHHQSNLEPEKGRKLLRQLAQSTARGLNDDGGTQSSVFGSEDPGDTVGRGLAANGGESDTSGPNGGNMGMEGEGSTGHEGKNGGEYGGAGD